MEQVVVKLVLVKIAFVHSHIPQFARHGKESMLSRELMASLRILIIDTVMPMHWVTGQLHTAVWCLYPGLGYLIPNARLG